MKKNILSIMVTAAIFAACTPSSEEQAKQLINDYLQKNMNDPKSYEALEFGTLDSTFTTFNETGEYKELDALYKRYIALAKLKQSEKDYTWAMAALDTAEIYANDIRNKEAAYVPQHSGWQMLHSFRGTNGFGAVTKNTNTFYFNMSLSEVVYVK